MTYIEVQDDVFEFRMTCIERLQLLLFRETLFPKPPDNHAYCNQTVKWIALEIIYVVN